MRYALRLAAAAALLVTAQQYAVADATIPTEDIEGARDNALLKRYDGSFIVSYEFSEYTDFKVPLSPLERTDRTDRSNNTLFLPQKERELEGALTRLVYLLPEGRSTLEVLRNYEDVITAAGGQVLFSCDDEECGGDPTRAAGGGGGESSLMMYFVVEQELNEPDFSNGDCALTEEITDQRFLTAMLPHPNGNAFVTAHTYEVIDDLYCEAFNGRTIAVIHILEPEARDQNMVVVAAGEMAAALGDAGHIALYGIFFDTDRTDIKPESAPTLEQIATLLRDDPRLSVLIVGHTDSEGSFDYNLDLSRRRAESVLSALVSSYGIDRQRLVSAGAGMMAPAATNDTEDGRARNRRVELVKLN